MARYEQAALVGERIEDELHAAAGERAEVSEIVRHEERRGVAWRGERLDDVEAHGVESVRRVTRPQEVYGVHSFKEQVT